MLRFFDDGATEIIPKTWEEIHYLMLEMDYAYILVETEKDAEVLKDFPNPWICNDSWSCCNATFPKTGLFWWECSNGEEIIWKNYETEKRLLDNIAEIFKL